MTPVDAPTAIRRSFGPRVIPVRSNEVLAFRGKSFSIRYASATVPVVAVSEAGTTAIEILIAAAVRLQQDRINVVVVLAEKICEPLL